MPQRDMREGIRESLNRFDTHGRRKGTRASRNYDGFFEGYVEVPVSSKNGNGRVRIKRIYQGDYFSQDLTSGRQVLLRLLYFALWGGAMMLFVTACLQPLPCNHCWYTALAQAVSVALIGWMISPLASYLTLYGRLTAGAYKRSAVQLSRQARLASVSVLALTAVSFAAMIVVAEPFGAQEYLLLFSELAAAGLLYAIAVIEGNVRWKQSGAIPSREEALKVQGGENDEG